MFDIGNCLKLIYVHYEYLILLIFFWRGELK